MSSFMGGGHRSSSDRLLNNYMYVSPVLHLG